MSGRRAQSLPPHMLEPVKPQRGKCISCICFTWKVFTCIVSHMTLILLVVSYCVGGAYLFQYLESPHEVEVKKNMSKIRLGITDHIWDYSSGLDLLSEITWSEAVNESLVAFEREILFAIKTGGWDGIDDVNKTQWTFAGSLFYSIIVITTIGYGHISPRTDWGKVTTIFYAIIGIPLMLLCLSNIGDVMASSFRFIYWRICCYMCTRNQRKTRSRSRSVRGHRYSARSQPPPYRRSMRMSQRSSGIQHAYSDPELRTSGRNDYERDIDYGRGDRRMQAMYARGTSERRRDHPAMTAPPSHRGGSRHMAPYEDEYMMDERPMYTQTLNPSAGRFSNRLKNRDRLHDRHTVERERHLSRSKHNFDSMEDLDDLPPTTKRAMSVRSMRSPQNRQDELAREPPELQRLNSQQGMMRGKSMPHPNSRARAKSVDPRLSTAHFEDVDEEVVRKTPIIQNRYALTEMEHRESRNKKYLRSQSMPRSAFHKNSLNQPRSAGRQQYAQDDMSTSRANGMRQSMPPGNHNHIPRRGSLGRPSSVGPNSRYGNRLELPDYATSRRMKQPSPRRHEVYEEEYEDQYMDDPEDEMSSHRRDRRYRERDRDRDYDDYEYRTPRASRNRERRPKREKQERLPPSPRIMSPMGFAVKRQIRRRPSYDDDDSMYGDDMSDYGDIMPKDRPVPIWLCVFLVISYILGGAALFHNWEGWTFLDSAYFCFITLTTIGFGDFVPAMGNKDDVERSIAYCSLYLLFGIALLAMSFNLVQEEFIANVKELARRLGIIDNEDDDSDDDDE